MALMVKRGIVNVLRDNLHEFVDHKTAIPNFFIHSVLHYYKIKGGIATLTK